MVEGSDKCVIGTYVCSTENKNCMCGICTLCPDAEKL
jgi:hypothetical protein